MGYNTGEKNSRKSKFDLEEEKKKKGRKSSKVAQRKK